jgi:hypothetical protein
MILFSRFSGVGWPDASERLENSDVQALIFEAIIFIGFGVSLAPWLPAIWATTHGKLLLGAVPLVAILLPLICYAGRRRLPGAVVLAGVFALSGGFLLRYAIVKTAPELLARGPAAIAGVPKPAPGTPGSGAPWLARTSPEDGRKPGERGADPGNRPDEFHPKTKVIDQE